MIKKSLTLIISICILLPVFGLVYWSFTSRLPWPNLISGHLDISAWNALLLQPSHWKSLLTSVLVSSLTVILVHFLVLPICIAVLIYKIKVPNLYWIVILMPLIIPSISLSIGLHLLFLKLGWQGGLLPIVLAHTITSLPYAFRILHSTCLLLGTAMGEQSSVLGASLIQTLFFVYLPNLKKPIILSTLLVFIVSFSQYLLTFLIGGGLIKTLPLALFPIIQSGSRSEAAAASLFFVLGAAFFMWLIEKTIHRQYKDGVTLWYL